MSNEIEALETRVAQLEKFETTRQLENVGSQDSKTIEEIRDRLLLLKSADPKQPGNCSEE